MEAIAVSHGVETTPDDHLWLCVAALDGLHDAPALLGGAVVHGNGCGHCSVSQGRLDSILSEDPVDLNNLPEPDEFAEQIIENLEAGLDSFREVLAGLR